MTKESIQATGRLILEEDFGGDLEAYATDAAGPAPKGIEKDPAHPWHLRKRNAIALVDMPDDHIPAPHLDSLYTRAEICEMLDISDSTFGKWQIPPVRKSGRYVLYSMTDVIYYRYAADAYLSGYREATHGKKPPENRHQLAARFKAEAQTESGPPPPIYYPEEETR